MVPSEVRVTLKKAVNAASDTMKRCTRCGNDVRRSEIFVMKVAFHMLGEPSSQKRSRTVDWLCPECLGKSDEWNIPQRSHTKVGKGEVTCDECSGQFPRGQIMVSKVIFYPLGEASRTVRSRTRAWKCYIVLEADASGRNVVLEPTCCMAKDEVYNLPEYRSSPGAREAESRGAAQ
jgi:hypothetical protein